MCALAEAIGRVGRFHRIRFVPLELPRDLDIDRMFSMAARK